jgi:hypothetical protein
MRLKALDSHDRPCKNGDVIAAGIFPPVNAAAEQIMKPERESEAEHIRAYEMVCTNER